MTVRVGINGFGRIGRNLFRAATERGADIDFVAVNDLGSLDTMAHLLKYDSILGTLPQTIKASKDGIKVGDDVLQVLQVRNPAELPWADLGVDLVVESTGLFTVPRQGRRPPRRRRAARRRVRPVGRRRRHVRGGRQPHRLRPQGAQGRLQRQLHDELLRPDGQGARRRLRRRAGPDDHDPRLHRRPDARRRPAQGPPPRPRRRHQHRPDEHRRRPRHQPRAGVDEGPARRHLAARPGAHRLDHRLQRHPRRPRPASPTSTPPSPRPPSPDRSRASSATPRTRSCPATSRATRTRASSTPS